MTRGDDFPRAREARPGGRPGTPDAASRMQSALAQVEAQHSGTTRDGRAGRYRDLCRAGTATLPVRGASLVLVDAAGAGTLLAASDPLAEQVADLELITGDGPAGQASRTGTPMLEADLDARRWPLFAPGARQLGVRAVFAFPLQLGAIRIGVLALDHDRTGPLDAGQLTAAHLLVRACVAAVLNDLDHDDHPVAGGGDKGGHHASPDGWMAHLNGYQDRLHQATGMVLVQLGVTAEVALLRLRAHAFANNQPLSEVAAAIVARRLSFQKEPGDPL